MLELGEGFCIYKMDAFGSIKNESPSSHELEIQTLETELSNLEKDISANVSNGLLGIPVLEYEKSAKREVIDAVSEKLHWEVARLRTDLGNYKSADPDPSPHTMWSSLSSIFFRRASERDFKSEVSLVSTLLQDTVNRRAPYIGIYQLVYQKRLAEQSYTFFCHEDDFSSLARKYAELRERHQTLYQMGVELVLIHETVFNLSTSSPSVLCQRITDSLLLSFEIALRINAELPDAGRLFTQGIDSGWTAVGRFSKLLLYYMSQECAPGRVGRKGTNSFRREHEYEGIMADSIKWRNTILGNEMGLRRHQMVHGALRMSAFPEKRIAIISRELTAQLMVRDEVAKWNEGDAVGDLRTHQSSQSQAEESNIALVIDSKAFNYPMLAQKFLQILNTRILFSGPENAVVSTKVYDGGLAQIYKVSISKPIEFQSGGSSWWSTEVAVKVFSKSLEADACEMLLREARVWSKLTHENILPLFGVWEKFDVCGMHSGALGLVSPWLDTGTLQSFLHKNPSTPDTYRIRLLADIADALCFLHGQIFRIAHGDVKANNVMLRDDRALLCDFGMSKIYDGVAGLSTYHSRNWRWQAPELLFGPANAINAEPTPESDIYSFGMLCLEVMSGRVPWEELGHIIGLQKRMESRYMIPRRPRTKIKDTTLWDLMRRCWKDAPTLRPTAQEAAKELRRLVLFYSEEEVLA